MIARQTGMDILKIDRQAGRQTDRAEKLEDRQTEHKINRTD